MNHSSPRLGIFGGTFDPVHLGHLWIASAAIETLNLDQLWFVPAARNPLKPDGPVAEDADRLRMLQLAVGGHSKMRVDSREIDRAMGDDRADRPSFTVDTLESIANEQADAVLFLIVGGDSLASFDRWHRVDRITELATIAAVRRGGGGDLRYDVLRAAASPAAADAARRNEIVMPIIELSASVIRDRLAAGRTIRYLVPAAVEAMIVDRARHGGQSGNRIYPMSDEKKPTSDSFAP